jgi:hypothetical protein
MRELVRLWLVGQIFKYDLKREQGDAYRSQMLVLLARAGRTPMVLGAATASFVELSACRDGDFDALMQGSRDPVGDGWIVLEGGCMEWAGSYAKLAPARGAAILLGLIDYGAQPTIYALPAYAWLTGKGLEHVDPADRDALAARLYRGYAMRLFLVGLDARAFALLDTLSPAMRAQVTDATFAPLTVHVDGVSVKLEDGRSATGTDLREQIAAAHLLAGRTAEAKRILETLPDLAYMRGRVACAGAMSQVMTKEPSGCSVRDNREVDYDLLTLDHLLNDAAGDPYLIAEAMEQSSLGGGVPSGTLGTLRCRVFAEPQFPATCADAREATARQAAPPSGNYRSAQAAALLAALRDADLPGIAEQRADFEKALATIVTANGGATARDHGSRTSIDPAPSPFAEAPLPKLYRKPRPKAASWSKTYADLPQGFAPVRVEQQGQRVVAISLSQNLDPTGEVSGGAYWVHVSEDGGRSWQAPLYTALAENFPYVVPSSSAMPLIDGDALNLEVEIAEIDTASIMYPPVATMTRRKARDLYLRLPLADLRRDSDGNGLSDIAAHRLLLDTPAGPGGTPFVVGSDAARCTATPTPERRATMTLLEKIFGMRSQALVEQVDRKGDLAFGGWRGAAISAGRPMIMTGDPSAYACLHPDRLMIVYSPADIERLRNFSPDFNGLSLPPITFNRTHDRGFVAWSTGWSGGTYRLRLVKGEWVFDPIMSWVT